VSNTHFCVMLKLTWQPSSGAFPLNKGIWYYTTTTGLHVWLCEYCWLCLITVTGISYSLYSTKVYSCFPLSVVATASFLLQSFWMQQKYMMQSLDWCNKAIQWWYFKAIIYLRFFVDTTRLYFNSWGFNNNFVHYWSSKMYLKSVYLCYLWLVGWIQIYNFAILLLEHAPYLYAIM